jgi:hypothetical protein
MKRKGLPQIWDSPFFYSLLLGRKGHESVKLSRSNFDGILSNYTQCVS